MMKGHLFRASACIGPEEVETRGKTVLRRIKIESVQKKRLSRLNRTNLLKKLF